MRQFMGLARVSNVSCASIKRHVLSQSGIREGARTPITPSIVEPLRLAIASIGEGVHNMSENNQIQ